jgi:hypothetical protein
VVWHFTWVGIDGKKAGAKVETVKTKEHNERTNTSLIEAQKTRCQALTHVKQGRHDEMKADERG